MIALILRDYFYLRQRLPIFLYIFYIHFKKVDNSLIDTAIKTCLATIGLIFSFILTGFILKIPFTSLIPFKWHYQGPLTWGAFFLVYYRSSIRKNINKLTSFTLATLATVGAGWLYEIPFFHPPSTFTTQLSLFYINGQYLCLLLLAYEIVTMNFRPNKPIYATFFFLIIYSVLLFNNPSLLRLPYHTWFMRIPTCLFLLSLLGGINISRARERDSSWYDRNFNAKQLLHYSDSPYYSMWRIIADRICEADELSSDILDIGCGCAQISGLLHDIGVESYHGVDFSLKMLEIAKANNPQYCFTLADLNDVEILDSTPYDVVISTEFLEHIWADLPILRKIRSGTKVYATVPNFSSIAHVRFFKNPRQVASRYSEYFNGFKVDTIRLDSHEYFLFEGVKKDTKGGISN